MGSMGPVDILPFALASRKLFPLDKNKDTKWYFNISPIQESLVINQ